MIESCNFLEGFSVILGTRHSNYYKYLTVKENHEEIHDFELNLHEVTLQAAWWLRDMSIKGETNNATNTPRTIQNLP